MDVKQFKEMIVKEMSFIYDNDYEVKVYHDGLYELVLELDLLVDKYDWIFLSANFFQFLINEGFQKIEISNVNHCITTSTENMNVVATKLLFFFRNNRGEC